MSKIEAKFLDQINDGRSDAYNVWVSEQLEPYNILIHGRMKRDSKPQRGYIFLTPEMEVEHELFFKNKIK